MKVSEIINNYLVWFILLAAVLGLFLTQFSFLSNYVSFILFFMILGLGFNLEFSGFVKVIKTPWKVLAVILVQYSVIPLLALLLIYFIKDSNFSLGILVLSAAPSEITSALMVHLAIGNVALGTTIMAISILLAPFLMPLVLSFLVGKTVNIDSGDMFRTLLAIVVLPVVIGTYFRTKFKKLANYKEDFAALSSLMVILLIFVVASNNSTAILNINILGLALILLIFNLISYGIGYFVGRIVKPAQEYKSYIFTIGMKEFGIATAVAFKFFGGEVAVPAAIYGIIILITAPIIAKMLKDK